MVLYYTPMNWRRVQFGLTYPDSSSDVVKAADRRSSVPPKDSSLFIASEAITDVRSIRDWLHDQAHVNGRYDLYGCYTVDSKMYWVDAIFRGIVITFQQALHAVHFRLAWTTSLLTDV